MISDQDSAQEMYSHVSAWKESGLTQAAYAKRYGMTRHKLEYWIKKAKSQKSQEEQGIKFVELKSLIASDNSQEKISVESPGPQMTLTFPSGLCLKIY